MDYTTMQNLHPIDVSQVIHFVIYAGLAATFAVGILIKWCRG